MATAPKISNLPTAPNRQQPANFSAKGDALLSSLQGFATEANALGDYVEGAAGQVAIDKAAVDANVPLMNDAKAAAPLALSYRDTAKTYRDAAAASEAKALQHKNDAASAVVYQDLASIAQSKSLTMVDGCIDTSPNPPLAVQRRTSWFAELGPMPARKVVIAELRKVSIFNGDDPSCPLWVEFFASGGLASDSNAIPGDDVTAVDLLNGVLVVGTINSSAGRGGTNTIDFGSDTISHKGISTLYQLYNGGIALRNSNKTFREGYESLLVNAGVRSVALHVASDAPISPVSGLPIPTTAVGTLAGVTVILNDYTTRHSLSALGFSNVVFDPDGGLYACRDNFGAHMIYASSEEYKNNGFGVSAGLNSATSSAVAMLAGAIRPNSLAAGPNVLALAGRDLSQNSRSGLLVVDTETHDLGSSMTAFIDATSNTGWMPKGIIGSYMSGAEASSLVGSAPLDTTFQGTGNLAGFILAEGVVNNNGVNKLAATSGPASNVIGAIVLGGLTAGAYYEAEIVRLSTVATSAIFANVGGLGGTQIGTEYDNINTPTSKVVFKVTGTQSQIHIRTGSSNTPVEIAGVSVRRVDPNRYLSPKSLTVKGVLQRSPVATGAELMKCHGGFDANNHLHGFIEDFNSKSFYLAMWFLGYGGSKLLMGTGDLGTLSKGRSLYINGAGMLVASGWSNDVSSEMVVLGGRWHLGVAQWEYLGGTDYNVSVAVDGVVKGHSKKALLPFDNKDFYVGYHPGSNSNGTGCEMALARVGLGTIPSDKIAKMYRDELPLFQPNSKATLRGTSNDVMSVAYDRTTCLIQAGGPSGRTEISGITPVGGSDAAITTKIASHDGMILEQ